MNDLQEEKLILPLMKVQKPARDATKVKWMGKKNVF